MLRNFLLPLTEVVRVAALGILALLALLPLLIWPVLSLAVAVIGLIWCMGPILHLLLMGEDDGCP